MTGLLVRFSQAPSIQGYCECHCLFRFCAQRHCSMCVCTCLRGSVCTNLSPSPFLCIFARLFSWQLLRLCMSRVYVHIAVLSTLGCCDLGYHLCDRQVSAVLWGTSRHINNKTSCQAESLRVRATHSIKLLTPVIPLRWWSWSAGYCPLILLRVRVCTCFIVWDFEKDPEWHVLIAMSRCVRQNGIKCTSRACVCIPL